MITAVLLGRLFPFIIEQSIVMPPNVIYYQTEYNITGFKTNARHKFNSEFPWLSSHPINLPRERNYYLLTDLIARLNISRSTFSQSYPAFKTLKMKWRDFARLLGKVIIKMLTSGLRCLILVSTQFFDIFLVYFE